MNDGPLAPLRRRLPTQGVPWDVVGLACYASVGIAAGIWGFDWTVVVGEVPRPVGSGPVGPEVAVFRPVRVLGPVVFGTAAAVLWNRRPRLAAPLVGVAALLTANVLVQQHAMYVPREGAARLDYVLGLGLYLAGTVGLAAAAFFGARNRHRRAGVALWATGASVMAAVVWYVFRVSGPDGLWEGFLLVQVGPAATLWSGALLVVAGGVLAQRSGVGRMDDGTPASASSASSASRVAPVGALLLTGAALTGVLAGTRLARVVTAFPPAATDRVRHSVGGAALGDGATALLTVALLVAAVLSTRSRDRWRRLAAPLAFACGSVLTTVPFRTVFNQRVHAPVAPGLYLTAAVGVTVFAVALLFGSNRRETNSDSVDGRSPFRRRVQPGAALVALAGAGLVLAGTVLHWVVALPGTGADPAAATTLAGVGVDTVLVGVVGAGLAGAVAVSMRSGPRAGGLVLFATGSVGAGLSVATLVAATGTGGVATNGFVVGPGGAVALLGCTLLVVAGAVQHEGAPASTTATGTDATDAGRPDVDPPADGRPDTETGS